MTSSWRDKPPTEKQKSFLKKFEKWENSLTRGEAADLINEIIAARQDAWAHSFPECPELDSYGHDGDL